MTREGGWLRLAIILTAANFAIALALMPRVDGLVPALRILPAWMAGASLAGVIMLVAHLARQGVASPIRELAALLKRERGRVIGVLLILLVAGLNMVAFMWIKTLLNYLVPFWADPLLAYGDSLIFLGADPWRLLAPYVFPGAGKVYHPLWFTIMIVLLVMAAWAPASARRSAVLLSYFLLWSVVGPLVHCLLPAGGPIFYAELGYGPRFADIVPTGETREVASYLWEIFSSGSFGAGSGISAMPSMHVTMSAWMVIASAALAPRLLVPVSLSAALVAVLSVALGWHYALDGIVGGLCALAVYRILLALFAGEFRQKVAAAPQGA